MSDIEMLMPKMGESIAEATIVRWVKEVGDTVKKDETVLEISTDKVDSEVPAPASGTLTAAAPRIFRKRRRDEFDWLMAYSVMEWGSSYIRTCLTIALS